MTAQDLLQNIQTAGGVARIRTENGVAKLNIAPSRIAKDFASEIKKLKPALLELLASKATTNFKPDVSPSAILTKWHSRGARLWLGTVTIDGLDYRTLEYEFDSSISPKWLKELERDKGFIQTALVAQEVRELSRRYWEQRRAEQAEAKAKADLENETLAESSTNSPEAQESPLTPQTATPIDWEYIDHQRALQDALSNQLGPRRATQAIYEATNEILTKWKGIGMEASKDEIQLAALELLCMRHAIPFDDCFDTEISRIEPDEETNDESDEEQTKVVHVENGFEALKYIIETVQSQRDTTDETTHHPQSESDNLTLGF